MKTKSAAESKRVLEKFLSEMRRLRWHVTRLKRDLGSEYVNNRKTNPIQNSNLSRCLVSTRKFVDVQKKNITLTQALKGASKLNDVVERYNRTRRELANAFLYCGCVAPIVLEYVY